MLQGHKQIARGFKGRIFLCAQYCDDKLKRQRVWGESIVHYCITGTEVRHQSENSREGDPSP